MAVYFIAEEGTERVKIGVSQYPWRRLQELQSRHPKDLVLMRVVDGITSTERQMHRTFAHLRLDGEWFRYSDDMFDVGKSIDIGHRNMKYFG
jgi:hypothetical protein